MLIYVSNVITWSLGTFCRGNLRQQFYCLFLFSPWTCLPALPLSVLSATADMYWWPPTTGWHYLFLPTFFAMSCEHFHLSLGLWAALLGFLCLPPPPFGKALSVNLASATLLSFFLHEFAGPISSDLPLFLSGFLLSQLLGMLMWLSWPGTGSTCLLSSPMLMGTPISCCWRCIPGQSSGGRGCRCPSEEESCLFLPRPPFMEATRRKGPICVFSSLFFTLYFTSILVEKSEKFLPTEWMKWNPRQHLSPWKTMSWHQKGIRGVSCSATLFHRWGSRDKKWNSLHKVSMPGLC